MCRTAPVAMCKTVTDMEVAQFNGRLVLEIDPACPPTQLHRLIDDQIVRFRDKKARQSNRKPWVKYRILALFDLLNAGYDPSSQRKQLAAWLFPEVKSLKARGDSFDRAREVLDQAISTIPALRVQSQLLK